MTHRGHRILVLIVRNGAVSRLNLHIKLGRIYTGLDLKIAEYRKDIIELDIEFLRVLAEGSL